MLAAAFGGAAHADIQGPVKKKPSDQPPGESAKDRVRRAIEIPTPKAATIRALRGKPTEIVIEATTPSRQAVEFRLGEMPRHGTLTPPQPSPDSKDRAIVIYTAAADGTAHEDQFTFRARHRDTATSGAARVTIEIIDQKPALEIEREVDFGDVTVGESAVRQIVIKNVGTGAMAARLELDPPWRLLDSAGVIAIEPGAHETLRVGFSPLAPGDAGHVIEFAGIAGGKVSLRAKGVAPFEVRPEWVTLEWVRELKIRRGRFSVSNRTPSPLSIVIEAPDRLHVRPPDAELAAGAGVDIEMTLPTSDSAGLQAPVTVAARGCRVDVPVVGSAAPPFLDLEDMTSIKSERGALLIPVGGEAVTLVVANGGGSTAPLFINCPGGFEVVGFVPGRDLKPGDRAAFGIKSPESRGTPPEGELTLELGEDRLPIALRAHRPEPPVRPPIDGGAAFVSGVAATTSTTVANSADTTDGEEPEMTADEIGMRAMLDTVGVFPREIVFDRSLPEVDQVRMKSMAPTRLTLAWKPVGPDFDYVLFRQEYRPIRGDHVPTRHWVPWNGLRFKKSASEVEVTLKGLQPERRHSLRLAVKAPDGKLGPASVPFVAVTPSRKSGLWWKILLGSICVGGIGWIAWRRWRERWEYDDAES